MEPLDKDTDGSSLNIVESNIEQLKALFPDSVSEGKIDFDKLREALGDAVETQEERYNFSWNGKALAKRIAQTKSTGTLRPCKAESKNWDTTQNLFIEGDNLEVLKLLQKSYHKQVKMIYIDPPYNTGKEFIYPDNYKDNLDTYLQYTHQKDEDGRKFGTNADTSGRYHTNWLNMMYPRLKLARNLLRDDGVIFISIDDHELSNLQKLCDEIFGEENSLAIIIWQHSLQPKGYAIKKALVLSWQILSERLTITKTIQILIMIQMGHGELVMCVMLFTDPILFTILLHHRATQLPHLQMDGGGAKKLWRQKLRQVKLFFLQMKRGLSEKFISTPLMDEHQKQFYLAKRLEPHEMLQAK